MGNACVRDKHDTIGMKRRTLPKSALKEVKRKMKMHLKEIALASEQRIPSLVKKEQQRSTTELNKKSVVNYLMMYPDFLDTLIINHVSQDRVKAWLKESREKSGESAKEETDQDFTAELMEKSFRHRQILMITRSRLFYPLKYKRDELNELIERPTLDEYEEEIESHLFPYTEVPPEDINKVFILMVKKLLGKFAPCDGHILPFNSDTETATFEVFTCIRPVGGSIDSHTIEFTDENLGFPRSELCYFLSCLRNNYHNIEYHNYSHALSHAQSMYWILSRNLGVFNEIEVKALMISAIAHDVGHPGVNDYYMKTTSSGLEKLYFSPILEHHHTQTTFLILQMFQQDEPKQQQTSEINDLNDSALAHVALMNNTYDINCNVFCNLEGDDYKMVLDEIQHDILSTSLARYKVQCENMRHIIATGLDFRSKKVRDAIKSVLMMTCDLCASWKSWQEHKNTVWSLYKEFFYQGDKQSNFHIDSAPQMLRMNADKIPEYQVQFMENVLIPVFQIASKVFPNISEIVDCTKENLDLWNTYIDK